MARRCAGSCTCSHGRSLNGGGTSGFTGAPAITSRAMRCGCAAAASAATRLPKEKASTSTGAVPSSARRPSSTGSTTASASLPEAGQAESPKPGRSGTNRRRPVAASGSMLRSQWFQLPLPPCSSTSGRPLPHRRQTMVPSPHRVRHSSARASRAVASGRAAGKVIGGQALERTKGRLSATLPPAILAPPD